MCSSGNVSKMCWCLVEACELLRVYKDVFEDVLLDAKQEEWAERLAFMMKIPEFAELTESELKSLNESARLESFEYENVSDSLC